MRSAFLLWILPMIQAEGTMAHNSPRGDAKRMLPRAASERSRARLMSGMRVAQEAKTMPMKKKKTMSTRR